MFTTTLTFLQLRIASKTFAVPITFVFNVSSGLEDTVNEMGMENIADEYGQRS